MQALGSDSLGSHPGFPRVQAVTLAILEEAQLLCLKNGL